MASPKKPMIEPSAGAATEKTSELPDELLKIPAMQGLFSGNPPAISATIADFEKHPSANIIIKNIDGLQKAGMSRYRSLSGDLGVIFNSNYISGTDVQAADKAGTLTAIAPPFDIVNTQIAASGLNNPVLTTASAAPAIAAATAAPAPTVPPASQAQQRKALAARLTNMKPGAPISGSSPGTGSLVRAITKPVV